MSWVGVGVGGGLLDFHKEVQLHLLYSWNAGLTLYSYDIMFTDVANAKLNMNYCKKKSSETEIKKIVRKLVYLTCDSNIFLN